MFVNRVNGIGPHCFVYSWPVSTYTTQMAEVKQMQQESTRSAKLNIYRKLYRRSPISRSLAFKDTVARTTPFMGDFIQ